jgi:endonuclease-8
MPEGDTIHHAANRIRAVLLNAIPDEFRCPQARHQLDRWPQRLAGRRVRAVDAHGKHLFLRFDGDLTLHSHLRMTGSWAVYQRGRRWRRSAGRAWLVLRAGDHEVVQFDGPVLELMTESRTRFDQRLARLGPDILAEDFDERAFLARLREDDPRRSLGDALLDQRTVAGIGNLWKAEACFLAGLDPGREIRRVTDEEARAVVGAARREMAQSARGGRERRPRAVYRRAGRPCPRCGAPIQARGQGDDNRATYWCAACQS